MKVVGKNESEVGVRWLRVEGLKASGQCYFSDPLFGRKTWVDPLPYCPLYVPAYGAAISSILPPLAVCICRFAYFR